jgi:glycosyltransferase involved in cell wall biosynthesis
MAVEACRSLVYPREKLEVLLVRGAQPSVQRNVALKQARGDLIYFLDDDSLTQPDNLQRAARHFQDPKIEMVGGPNVCPPEAPLLEQSFAATMSAWLAFGPSRARYTPTGSVRASSEKELILCNLMARRNTLLKLGGFDEALYPNEENALMDAIQKDGGVLLYDPAFSVFRRPRRTLPSFIKMLLNYGRGRAEQFRLHPTPGSALNFVPPLFCVYLVSTFFLPPIALLPLIPYLLGVLVQSFTGNPIPRALCVAPLIVLTHIFYGVGFWRGLFFPLKSLGRQKASEVLVERPEV